MTVLEKHFDFRLLTDEIEALANKSFNAAEIDWLLNRSQIQLVKSYINLNNPRKEGFEMDQKRIDDLKGILVKFPEQPYVNLIHHAEENIYELDLSRLEHTYYFYVRGKAVYVDSQENSTSYSLIQIQHDDFNDSFEDPFSVSCDSEVLINFGRSSDGDGSSIYFYPKSNQFLTKASIEYIKEPNTINLGTYTYIDGTNTGVSNTDLDEHLHQEIVNGAVQLAASIMKDQVLYQTMQHQTLIQE